MKNLTKVNKYFYIFLFLIMIFSIVFIVWIFLKEVNKTISVSFLVDEKKNLVLVSKNNSSYLIDEGQTVNIQIFNKTYSLKIENIKTYNNLLIVEFDGLPKNIKLIPNTKFIGTLFYGKTTFYNLLFS
ncbi:MAG1140 family protein [Mycoplasma sp. Mirounga ES2805-ORL]|uniref:MAG1140 family protein n=1 Tax=Mycoplasma sp. Mirounga ES2805-ORL TaxID=754514 RepID=UPI00197C9630|nr:hypothetical protein [Mycoplasma sp. Mirounga ES2805-ORL]QSF13475.1 hypothetical protein JXZ90_02240 [Mycoplasma sp. Mirounga ES2805-ORL]